MIERPNYFMLGEDHVVVHVEVSVPWLSKEMHYQHALDMPALREEFGPLPEVDDPLYMFRREGAMRQRKSAVDAIAHTIARSILDAMGMEKP